MSKFSRTSELSWHGLPNEWTTYIKICTAISDDAIWFSISDCCVFPILFSPFISPTTVNEKSKNDTSFVVCLSIGERECLRSLAWSPAQFHVFHASLFHHLSKEMCVKTNRALEHILKHLNEMACVAIVDFLPISKTISKWKQKNWHINRLIKQ